MKTANAVIFSLAIVLSAFFIGNSYSNRSIAAGTLNVTGLGQVDFTSDLIVWSGTFSETSTSMKEAYDLLAKDHKKVLAYLTSNGVPKDDIVFEAVTTNYVYRDKYSPEGKYVGQEMVGYKLSQDVNITSRKVETIENVSREVTELINQGINFYSSTPSYYYTKLADLKLQLIQKATEDAYTRAEKIAKNSGSHLGKLLDANMGVFQITGQYSKEDYSWGGVFNTTSKNKTASITVRLKYKVK